MNCALNIVETVNNILANEPSASFSLYLSNIFLKSSASSLETISTKSIIIDNDSLGLN